MALDYATFTADEWGTFTADQWETLLLDPSAAVNFKSYTDSGQLYCAGATSGEKSGLEQIGCIFSAGAEKGQVS